MNDVCPLRSEIIPKHIRIDTTSLVHLCFSEEQCPKEEYLTKGNLVKYQDEIHRKLKLGSFIRRQITESRMLRRFEKIFGSGKETIITIGDFEQRQHRRFKGKGFRSLFRRAGYKVYMVDEFRTSCRCNQCENPKFWREGIMKRHGLLRCKNGCGLWNRDTNGAINIWKIAVRAIGGKERPEYLKRTKRSNSGVSSTPTNQDLHEDRQCLQGSGRFKCPTV